MSPTMFVLALVMGLPIVILLAHSQQEKIHSDACKFNSTSEFADEVVSQRLKISIITTKYPGVIIDGKRYFAGTASKRYKKRGRNFEFLGYKELAYTSMGDVVIFRARKVNDYIVTQSYVRK